MAFGRGKRFSKKTNEENKTAEKKSAEKTVLQLAELAEIDEKIANSKTEKLIDDGDTSTSDDEKEKRKKEREEKIKEARAASRKTEKDIQQAKTEKLMNLIAERASFYRANPHRFVEEFLGIHLKLFQKILIYAMMVYDYFFFVAARG